MDPAAKNAAKRIAPNAKNVNVAARAARVQRQIHARAPSKRMRLRLEMIKVNGES